MLISQRKTLRCGAVHQLVAKLSRRRPAAEIVDRDSRIRNEVGEKDEHYIRKSENRKGRKEVAFKWWEGILHEREIRTYVT